MNFQNHNKILLVKNLQINLKNPREQANCDISFVTNFVANLCTTFNFFKNVKTVTAFGI